MACPLRSYTLTQYHLVYQKGILLGHIKCSQRSVYKHEPSNCSHSWLHILLPAFVFPLPQYPHHLWYIYYMYILNQIYIWKLSNSFLEQGKGKIREKREIIVNCQLTRIRERKLRIPKNRIKTKLISSQKNSQNVCPAGVPPWIECRPVNRRVTTSIPSQGICLGCRPGPQ